MVFSKIKNKFKDLTTAIQINRAKRKIKKFLKNDFKISETFNDYHLVHLFYPKTLSEQESIYDVALFQLDFPIYKSLASQGGSVEYKNPYFKDRSIDRSNG